MVWLSLCAYVLGMLAGHWHAAERAHEVCEHGEWVHVDHGEPSARDDQARGNGPVWNSASIEYAEEQHEHCGLWTPTLRPTLDTRAVLSLQPARESPQAAAQARTRHENGFALYLLAPGHSPPAA
jgi:hypothetical protein